MTLAVIPGPDDGEPFVVAAETKAQFAELMRRAARRRGLTGGQIHIKSGIPRESCYRYLREDTTTMPRHENNVAAFFKACALAPEQVTQAVELWRKLSDTTAGEPAVIDAEIVDSEPAGSATDTPPGGINISGVVRGDITVSGPPGSATDTPAGGINISGVVRGDVAVYVNHIQHNDHRTATVRMRQSARKIPAFYDRHHRLVAALIVLLAAVGVADLPRWMLWSWSLTAFLWMPVPVVGAAFLIGGMVAMARAILQRRTAAPSPRPLLERLCSWETAVAMLSAVAGGVYVGFMVQNWRTYALLPRYAFSGGANSGRARAEMMSIFSERGVAAGILFGILFFGVMRHSLGATNWRAVWLLTKRFPAVIVAILVCGLVAAMIVQAVLVDHSAHRFALCIGGVVAAVLVTASLPVITEIRWLTKRAEQHADRHPDARGQFDPLLKHLPKVTGDWAHNTYTALLMTGRYGHAAAVDLTETTEPTVADKAAVNSGADMPSAADLAQVAPEAAVEPEDSVAAFCNDLVQLKKAAAISYRDMETWCRRHISGPGSYGKSALAAATNPSKGLPKAKIVFAFVAATVGDIASGEIETWMHRRAALEQGGAGTGAPDGEETAGPATDSEKPEPEAGEGELVAP